MAKKPPKAEPVVVANRGRAPTMADIGRAVGVSAATVSRALAGLPPITEETRKLVEEAAQNAGYKVNRHARSLRSQRSRIILVVIPNLANQNFPDILESIERAAFDLGYDVMIGHLGSNPARSERLADELFTGGIDGILLTSRFSPARVVERIAAGDRLPIVRTLSPGEEGDPIDSILIDEEQAAYDVVRHLLENGYRRISYLNGPTDEPPAILRQRGWRRALAEAGLPYDPRGLLQGGFELEDGRDVARRLLAESSLPDAVFCSNDQSAFGMMQELKTAGVRIPDDMAVAGFDDLSFSQLFDPPLTTIRLPRKEMAEASLLYLTRLIDGAAPAGNQIVPHELIVRESSRPNSVASRSSGKRPLKAR